MDRRVRFGIWVVCAALALGGPAVVHPLVSSHWMLWKSTVVVLGLVGMLVLLLSTPGNAIRLPRWLSEVIVVAGAGLVYHHLGGSRSEVWALLTGAAAVMAFRYMRRGVLSPWWGCLAVWHPSLRLAIDQMDFGIARLEGAMTLVGWLIVIAGVLLLPLARTDGRSRAWLGPLAVWIVGTSITLFVTVINFW